MPRRGGGGGGTEMNPEPTLCLVMEKGPLQGQELKFSPGAKIQIGRILRGNTLAVKDAGVSTKHLVITFGADAGGWTISDLDSSNGTHLNSVTLEPFSQVPLSDGDIIKIGELTSIKVRIAVDDSKADMGKPPRVPKSVAETESLAEKLPPRRGRVSKKEEIVDGEAESVAEKLQPRRGRASKKEEIVDVEAESVAEKLRPRRGRVSKKEEIVDVEAEVVGVVETRRTTRARSKEVIPVEITSMRRTRSAKRGVTVEEPVTRKGARSRKNTSQTANEEEMVDAEIEDSKEGKEGMIVEKEITGNVEKANTRSEGNVEKSVTKKGARSRKNTRHTANEAQKVEEEKLGLEMEESKEVEEDLMVEKENVGNVEEMVAKKGSQLLKNTSETVNEVENVEDEKLGSKNEERKEVHEDLIVEKESVEDVKSAGGSGTQAAKFKELDLEKMTVGGLIDYLEEYLPQRIIAETEEMISKMKERSRRVHQYMLEQKKARGKVVG